MFRVIALCFGIVISISGQKLSYLMPHLLDARANQVEYSEHPIQGELLQRYDLPGHFYKTEVSTPLSKLYKPRPAELDKLLMEYQNSQLIKASQVRTNKVTDETASTNQLKKSKINSPDFEKYKYKYSQTDQSAKNSYNKLAQYTKSMYYSKLKPLYISNNDDGYDNSDNGYKTHEEIVEEDQPASNYDFSYIVMQPENYLNFGHEESKQGDLAKGMYYTLLPDGRTQYVEYEADHTGYKPRITYDYNHQI